MNLNAIDLNLFVAFDVIYAERNLTRASEVLNITQPAVSNTLARLRATFGDKLFVRTGNAMVPTPVAQSLVGPVRQALRQLRASVDQLKSFDPATSEKIFNFSLGDARSHHPDAGARGRHSPRRAACEDQLQPGRPARDRERARLG